jgi:hypothetical protein
MRKSDEKRRRKLAPSAAGGESAGSINYDEYDAAVAEGKKILANMQAAERDQLRLGELAAKVKTKYDDQTLLKFAKELGIANCTLERYRNVYRAWQGKLAPGPISVSYAVLRELQTHPERERIIRERPDLTKREAREEMRKYKPKKKKQNDKDQWLRDKKRWFRALVGAASEAARVAESVDPYDDEQLRKLLPAVDPGLLGQVHNVGLLLTDLAARLTELLGADADQTSARAHPEATAHAAAGA